MLFVDRGYPKDLWWTKVLLYIFYWQECLKKSRSSIDRREEELLGSEDISKTFPGQECF